MERLTLNDKSYGLPFADLLPPLTPEERQALLADVKEHGITVPVVVTDADEVIDGNTRLQIAVELGLTDIPVKVVSGLSDAKKREMALSLNLHRRHLTSEQKRQIIADRLRADATISDRQLAAEIGVDNKTASAVRQSLEATEEIPQLPETRGATAHTATSSRSQSYRCRQVPTGGCHAQRRHHCRGGRLQG